ncbi:hypothetical protein LO762_14890 [Actinocorallia sp. API 0066]|uniref:hypothetical protein n=1 Tax=Actinocorallia sp. API 0066 TaxID=2896846 RepID=UPI001E4C3185|nr:hypothetical protein [Actinocorallia sp. API 0066]MCD0450466.1 hypothetical protein [Actinocorallia sp. API 0066]
MIIKSSVGGFTQAPARKDGHLLVASLDVEWTKNYRIKNGNVPFCWSVTWLSVPVSEAAAAPTEFSYTSVYVENAQETQDLIDTADAGIAAFAEHADLIVGHQVSSDLAVLRNASTRPLTATEALRERWHQRRTETTPRVIDSRYDTGHVLTGTSRRLVDVCAELRLDVTQPELRRKSMTALHRDWLNDADTEARERITVLNLRHSLSAAYTALHATGRTTWHNTLNVNTVLHTQLAGSLAWLDTPTFRDLL